jgi:hypothetical protein
MLKRLSSFRFSASISHKFKTSILAAGLICGVVGSANASSINIPTDGSEFFHWGPASGGNIAVGQVFTVPSGNAVLTDYTLTVSSDAAFPFVSQVYAWNGTKIIGSPIYTSGLHFTTNVETPHTFFPGVGVTAGQQYLALVTNNPLFSSSIGGNLGGFGQGRMQANSGNPYSGGRLMWTFTILPDPNIWKTYSPIPDAQFNANFVVPEPGGFVMALVGLIGLVVWRRKR